MARNRVEYGGRILALAAMSAAAFCGCSRPAAAPQSDPPRAAPASSLRGAAAAAAPEPALQAAFAAVYPRARISVASDDGAADYDLKPQALVRLSDRAFALISTGRFAGNASHMDGGYASVAYLVVAGPKLALQGQPFHLQGTMGGFGEPPRVSVLDGVAGGPLLQVVTGFYNQGEGDSSAYLVALGPTIRDVAVVARDIPLSHTQAGANGEECDIDGRIAPVVADKTFEVRYSGAYSGRLRYRRSAGGWVSTKPETDLSALCRSAGTEAGGVTCPRRRR